MPDGASAYSDLRDRRWWAPGLTDNERAERLWWRADHIRRNDMWRKEQDMRRLRDYGHTPLVGFGLAGYTRSGVTNRKKTGYNVTKALCDTFQAKITKEDPRVSFVTDGGDWELQQRAKDNERFIQGQFYEMGFLDVARAAALDGGGIWGTGCVKFFIEGTGEDARIRCERRIPYDLLVDEQEAMRGNPKNLGEQCWVDRLVLEEMFADEPEKVAKIREATQHVDPHTGIKQGPGYDSTADQLLVFEAWHLKSGPNATDGRHAMAIDGCLLFDEPWPYDWYPFVFYRKQDPPVGFWGIGVAAEVEGLQTALNMKLLRLEEALRLCGTAHVLLHSSSRVNFSTWDNQAGSKIEWSGGVKPEIYVPAEVVPAQLIASIETDYHRSFELTGIPEAQAQGGTPTNLESGKAQEVYLDATDQRMNVWIKRYHQMFVDAAKIVLAFAAEIVEHHNPKFGARATDEKRGMQKILFTDIQLKEEEYVLQEWPTNLLSDEPAARMGQVEKMANAGWIAPDEAKRLLAFPDLQHSADLENASFDAVEGCIHAMLDEGRYMQPIPELNLQQAVKQVQLALIKAWLDGRPQDRQQLLRDWLNDARQLPNGPGQPQAPQTQASAGGTPVMAAAPGATPIMQGPPGPAGPAAPPQAA